VRRRKVAWNQGARRKRAEAILPGRGARFSSATQEAGENCGLCISVLKLFQPGVGLPGMSEEHHTLMGSIFFHDVHYFGKTQTAPPGNSDYLQG